MNYGLIIVIGFAFLVCATYGYWYFKQKRQTNQVEQTPTIEGFLTFLEGKRSGSSINQHTYLSCALGLYLLQCKVSKEYAPDFIKTFREFANELPYPVNERIRRGKGHPTSYKTYGELYSELKKVTSNV